MILTSLILVVTSWASCAASAATTIGNTTTPAGCLRLSSDSGWPTEQAWKTALPGVLPRKTNLRPGVARPDYRFRPKTVAEVQAAVKFCAKHKIRLTIINAGHDWVGRNDAPSGLSLDTSLFRGVRVMESFTPSKAGAASSLVPANTIVPVKGKQAAVTFGVGLTTAALNTAINPSKLLTMGAASGKSPTLESGAF